MFYNGKRTNEKMSVQMASDTFLKALNELQFLKKETQSIFDKLDISYGKGAFKNYDNIKHWLVEAEKKLAVEGINENWSELVGENFEVLVKTLLSVDYNHIVRKKLLKQVK